jgi:DNA topoisomerase-1
MKKSLVIVESPSKAKTINKYLGSDYIVEATVGHIKNLPEKSISVNTENGYIPSYEIIKGKEKVLSKLKEVAGKSDKLFIATDPDREGEAIASDISFELSSPGKKIYRVLFNEITKTAIEQAMKHPRSIDENLVTSQMARRVMDRLLGYKLSPFLWKVFYYGLSAGRVQSVALKLICKREEEIKNFIAKEYWTIDNLFVKLSGESNPICARLFKINNDTLKNNGEPPSIKNIDEAFEIIENLKQCKYKVNSLTSKDVKRNPPSPLITSVLQQLASTQLGFTPKKTMMLAQKLYEGVEIIKGEGNVGLITYMRTDSLRVSPEAQLSARDYITKNFGKEYIPEQVKIHKRKKNIQDAHESIRPTDVNIIPETLKKLDKDLIALYGLIWKRFLASQMSEAVLEQKTLIVETINLRKDKPDYYFKATGSKVKFCGYKKIFGDECDENGDDEKENEINIPDNIQPGDPLKSVNIIKEQHFTSPPPRYNESSLIKQLDQLGIGRPSTFALIISTVEDRKYVDIIDKRLYATSLGMAVNKVLSEYFSDVINVDFTAKMESELDTIANGEATYKEVLDEFYLPFIKDLKEVDSNASEIKKSQIEKTEILCPECGDKTNAKMVKKWGRNGQFLSCERFPKCTSAMPVVEENAAQPAATNIKCDLCGADMVLKSGRYGNFYGCSNYPKCKGIKPLTLGIKCPKCNDGEIIKRSGGKSRRTFFGCSKYPDCDFISNSQPVIRNCTNCKSTYLLKKISKTKGEYLQCPECKTEYQD